MAEVKTVAKEPGPVPSGKKGSFAVDVAKLATGTTLAQAMTVVVAPALSRIYGPEAFGTASVFASIVSIVGVVSCLRYELAIMLPERDEDAAALFAGSILFVLFATALTGLAVLLGRDLIVGLLAAPALAGYLWLLPLVVLASGVLQALTYWNSRTRRFGFLSIGKGLHSAVASGSELGLGAALVADAGGLIVGRLLGAMSAVVLLGRQAWRADREVMRQGLQWRRIRAGLSRYRKFPLFGTWSALLNTVSVQLPTLMLSAFFSPAVVGFYGLGARVLKMPISLVGGAIAQVFFQRASEADHDGRLAVVVEKTFERLLVLAALPFPLLAIISPELFAVVFGERWVEAGVIAQILAPWLFFNFLSSPISTLNSVLELQEIGLFFNIMLLVTRVGSLLVGGYRQNLYLALALFSASGTVLYSWLCYYLLSRSGVRLASFTTAVIAQLGRALAFLLPIIVAKLLLEWPATPLVLSGGLAAGLYYAYAAYRDKAIRALLVQPLNRS